MASGGPPQAESPESCVRSRNQPPDTLSATWPLEPSPIVESSGDSQSLYTEYCSSPPLFRFPWEGSQTKLGCSAWALRRVRRFRNASHDGDFWPHVPRSSYGSLGGSWHSCLLRGRQTPRMLTSKVRGRCSPCRQWFPSSRSLVGGCTDSRPALPGRRSSRCSAGPDGSKAHNASHFESPQGFITTLRMSRSGHLQACC